MRIFVNIKLMHFTTDL